MSDGQQQQRFPAPLRSDDRFAIWSQQMDDVLEKITHRWRGEREEYDREGRKVWKTPTDANPIMNDKGVDFVISQVHAFANKNSNLSNVKDTEVYRIVRVRAFSITKSLFLDAKEYNIRAEQFEELTTSICALFFFAAMRPLASGERKFLMNTGIENVIRQFGPGGQGPKLW